MKKEMGVVVCNSNGGMKEGGQKRGIGEKGGGNEWAVVHNNGWHKV